MEPVYEIEPLVPADAPANVALSHSVGWKDVADEWHVLHAAAQVRGVRNAGQLVAQGALGGYGNSATLAKMVVASPLQRRGLGARLLDGFLALADERGLPVGLCATELGRPLYASRNFVVSGEIMILVGTPQLGMEPLRSGVSSFDAEQALALDRRLSGCDRKLMLRERIRYASAKYGLDAGAGFALATPQGPHALVGPILAETEPGARQLAQALFADLAGPVRIDVPLEHVAFRSWLVGLGLQEVSQRVEMARGAARMPWQCAERFALATQAWG